MTWLREQRLDGMLGRWSVSLQEFQFTIKHIAGIENVLADCTSRQYAAAVSASPRFSNEELLAEQQKDPIITSVVNAVQSGTGKINFPSDVTPSLQKRWSQLLPQLAVMDSILYRQVMDGPREKPSLKVMVPTTLQADFVKLCHDPPYCGHLGVEKTLARLLSFAYWPGIRLTVVDCIANCHSCQEVKSKTNHAEDKKFTSTTTAPGEMVTADVLKLPEDEGYVAILVIVDAFSKYPVAYKLKNETAESLYPCFIDYFSKFGIPQCLLTDQGRNFESLLLRKVFQYFGVKKLRTTPYHPQTDGLTERMNQ